MKKVSLSLVVALNMLTSLYSENNATASTPEDFRHHRGARYPKAPSRRQRL